MRIPPTFETPEENAVHASPLSPFPDFCYSCIYRKLNDGARQSGKFV